METSRKLPSTYKPEQPIGVERITVEEITFPRRTAVTQERIDQVIFISRLNVHHFRYAFQTSRVNHYSLKALANSCGLNYIYPLSYTTQFATYDYHQNIHLFCYFSSVNKVLKERKTQLR